MKRRLATASIAAMLLSGALLLAQMNWASFGQDQGATRFSKLTQINTSNVQKLEPAWTFHTGAEGQNEMTPLVVDSVMYLSAGNGYYAVDAVTGKQIWKYDATGTTERGVSYWAGDAKSSARIIGAVTGNKVVALDAKTGKPIPGFGEEGFLDTGTRMQSPPAIYKDTMIAPSRDRMVRAWSLRSGAMVWSFNLVPQPGEPGHDSWKNDAWKTTGGVDVWGHITVDTTLGIAFVPTAPPSPDYVGVNRPGDTLYGTSLVALDANTGKLKWYHQLVHHDLWDMDSAAAPTLFDATVKGVKTPAVAHMAKTGLMYVFDRRNGAPLFGMEERAVPRSNVPGEISSPTQPFPVKPEPIARVSMKMSEIPKNVTPELTAYCQGLVDKYKLGDALPYNAWLLNQDIVELPGALGGGNWGGSSYNPNLGLIITNVQNVGQWGHIQTREAGAGGRGGFGASGGGRGRGGRGSGPPPDAEGFPAGGPPSGAAGASGGVSYGKTTPEAQRFWQADTRYSCAPTPWGELVAVNANTGDIAWRSTLGQFDELTAKGIPGTGAPNAGGSITTAGNLVFIGATVDSRFRAFDARNGKELWSVKVAAPAHSIPATYMGSDGRQYVVVSAAGGGFLRDITSDTVVAFALPKTK